MIGFDEASERLREVARPLGRENVAIAKAAGRILAEPVIAAVASPPQDCSAMDGYAVRDGDLATLPARLRVAGQSFAGGGHDGRVEPGCCIRIFTGAPLPPGADRVVIQEEVVREGDIAIVEAKPGEPRHVRRRGSDFAEGELLVPAGRRLDPLALVAAAGGDAEAVSVWRRPRVTVIGTGDELVEPGSARSTPGAIPESVSIGIAALAESCGALVEARLRLRDDLKQLEAVAAELVERTDLVVVTGGASVGERDYAKAMFAPSGLDLLFSKVAIKPGKPVWLGRAGRALVLGLPGNPTSALVTARLFLVPLLAGLTGGDPGSALRWRRARLAGPIGTCGGRETFVRAAAEADQARPLSNQDSGAQKMLVDADLLIRRLAHAPPASAGEMVDVIDF